MNYFLVFLINHIFMRITQSRLFSHFARFCPIFQANKHAPKYGEESCKFLWENWLLCIILIKNGLYLVNTAHFDFEQSNKMKFFEIKKHFWNIPNKQKSVTSWDKVINVIARSKIFHPFSKFLRSLTTDFWYDSCIKNYE